MVGGIKRTPGPVDSHCVSGQSREMTHMPPIGLEGSPLLEFQPAVDLTNGRLLGFEALLRWQHPSRGLIPPSVLVPWAEANNHILALNAWVLEEACRQATGWSTAIQLAVNCSLVQLRRHQASVAAGEALARSGLNPDRLTVEITESAVADEQANRDLGNLLRRGVHLAVDDVGTSWSTLENFRRFSIEIAKIDRAFTSALELTDGMNRAIVNAIVHVSHSLGMTTVAEGVETAEQVATLQQIGADVAQGYFFARPMSASEAAKLATQDPPTVFPLAVDDTDDDTDEETDEKLVAPHS